MGTVGRQSEDPGALQLSALLSQAWVAWTIEVDIAFEVRVAHRTTRGRGAGRGPWLTSSVMWWNCLRHLGDRTMTVRELASRAGLHTNLDGMRRWGYVEIDQLHADRSTWVLRATPRGRRAGAAWRDLPALIDGRWQARFAGMDLLRDALLGIVVDLDPALPDCLPIVGPARGFLTPAPTGPAPEPPEHPSELPLGALLARTLVAFTREAEEGARLGLPVVADLLRLLDGQDGQGVQVRDLPQRSGVSKEAQQMAIGVLERTSLAEVGADPEGTRFRVIRLTPQGSRTRGVHLRRLRQTEAAWDGRFGARLVALRDALRSLVATGELLGSLEPPPDVWRARLPRLRTLPHYPMVLHRGGYPDGA